jgi:DNA-binding NarL/FixJ family response regulator
MKKCRIVLADDHQVIRTGLKSLVCAQPDMTVVGEAGDGYVALEKIAELKPDVAVVDISMPRCSGVDVTKQVQKQCPNTKVVVLTVHEDTDYMRLLIESGAKAYVLKRSVAESLIGAIRAAWKNEHYLDSALGEAIAAKVAKGCDTNTGQKLSKRESAVLRLVAWGKTNKEIGPELGISAKTVETYRLRLMCKLGLKTREGVVQYAARRGWLQHPEDSSAGSGV